MTESGGGRIRAGCRRLIPLAAVLLLASSPPTLAAQSPRGVEVIGLDYAFQAPDTLPAGPVTFSLLNRGTVRHELIFFLLNEGRTLGELLRATTIEQRLALGRLVGLIIAEPGQPAGAQLVVDLARGRSYVYLCILRDAPDKPPHAAMGMAKALVVK